MDEARRSVFSTSGRRVLTTSKGHEAVSDDMNNWATTGAIGVACAAAGAAAKHLFEYLRGRNKDVFDRMMEWTTKLERRIEMLEQEVDAAKEEHRHCMEAHEATKAKVNELQNRVVELETEKRTWSGPAVQPPKA